MDLKIKDVADLLNVSETTIRRWLADGKIPGYRLNHQYRFSRAEIENWMIQCKLKPQETGCSPFGEKQICPAEEAEGPRNGMQQFGLYRAIHQGDLILLDKGTTKEEVIRSTADQISSALGVDREVLAELLLDRENMMPTALNNGVAVPHARDLLEGTTCDRVVVVFPSEPIEYGALDGKPVHTLFFLFACSDKRHLHLLAKLAHLCSDDQAIAFFKSKPEKKAALEFVRQWEQQLTIPQYSEAT